MHFPTIRGTLSLEAECVFRVFTYEEKYLCHPGAGTLLSGEIKHGWNFGVSGLSRQNRHLNILSCIPPQDVMLFVAASNLSLPVQFKIRDLLPGALHFERLTFKGL